jgi:flagellin-like hook-associated protein FlgL
VVDSSAASGVSYKGNTGTNSVTIGNGYQLQVNLPGSQIFDGAGADVFQGINDLINGLQNNSGVSAAVNEVSNALNYVTAQQTFYGNALNQTQSQQTYLSAEKVNLSQEQNTVSAADTATVASQLSGDQTAMDATLAAISKMPQTSLFDYLK